MDPPKAQDDPARPSSGRRTNEQARRRRHRVDPSALAQLLGTAVAAHQQGRLDEAREGYAAVLAENPRQPDALQLLGVLLHLRGERSAALSLLRRAVRVAPDHAPAHDNLARVLRETGKPEAALPNSSIRPSRRRMIGHGWPALTTESRWRSTSRMTRRNVI